jgi:hypothetical protein
VVLWEWMHQDTLQPGAGRKCSSRLAFKPCEIIFIDHPTVSNREDCFLKRYFKIVVFLLLLFNLIHGLSQVGYTFLCVLFIVCYVSLIVGVALCAVFYLSVMCYLYNMHIFVCCVLL